MFHWLGNSRLTVIFSYYSEDTIPYSDGFNQIVIVFKLSLEVMVFFCLFLVLKIFNYSKRKLSQSETREGWEGLARPQKSTFPFASQNPQNEKVQHRPRMMT